MDEPKDSALFSVLFTSLDVGSDPIRADNIVADERDGCLRLWLRGELQMVVAAGQWRSIRRCDAKGE